MKITLGKKFVTITPKPIEDIPNGIKITFENDTSDIIQPIAFTNILKGKSRYMLPTKEFSNNGAVIKAEFNVV